MSNEVAIPSTGEGPETGEPDIEINPLMHLIAPVAAIVGTMVVRKVMNSAYEKSTGHRPPEPRDPATSLTRAILWAGAIAATAAIAEVAIYRIVNAVGEKKFPA